jgi:DNA-binding NtrC family response regulator
VYPKKGMFDLADKGSVFFDEIGNVPLETQAKLLRVIQERDFMRLGGMETIKVDVRIIAATNVDLRQMMEEGHFREDLFYRLHVFPIAVPPLSERPEDIPELVRHFLARFAAEEGKRTVRVAGEALALLAAYRWPGNVRQLENAVFRAVVLAEADEIGVQEFPQIAANLSRYPEPAHAAVPTPTPIDAVIEAGVSIAPMLGDHDALLSGRIAPAAVPSSGALALLDDRGDVRPLEEVESEVIRFAITHYRGQMSEVARRLRIGRSTLYRKLDSLGLAAPDDSDDADSQGAVAG